MTDELLERLKRLFPQCEISQNEIRYRGGQPYISGYPDDLVVDGTLNAEQLQALADWAQTSAS